MALATSADVVARIGALNASQAAKVDALLDDATAELEAYIGPIEQRISDVRVLRPSGMAIDLPGRNITEVTSVYLIDSGVDREVTGWRWDGIRTVRLPGAQPVGSIEGTYRVTYTHGYASGSIPQVLKARAVKMANRVLTSPTEAEGLVSENIGQYQYQLQQGTASMGSGVVLTRADKEDLKAQGWRPQAHTQRTPSA